MGQLPHMNILKKFMRSFQPEAALSPQKEIKLPSQKELARSSQKPPACEAFTDRTTGFTGWRLHLDARRAVPTPALSGENLFVGGGFGSFEFYSINARTGATSWQLRTNDDGPTAAVLSEGLAVFNTESCTLEVVEMASGRVLWERWLGDPLLAQP